MRIAVSPSLASTFPHLDKITHENFKNYDVTFVLKEEWSLWWEFRTARLRPFVVLSIDDAITMIEKLELLDAK